MSRVIFKTGRAHQEHTSIWARQRLADANGRTFSKPDDQDGVLFADGVGLGKTWEALGAAALILYKQMPEKGRRHVLILCPANLVTKWEDELAAGSPFRERLDSWKNRLLKSGHKAAAQCVWNTLTHVLPIRSAKHVRTRLKRGKFHPPGGTYIISQSLIIREGSGLSALRKEEWDIVIVDEAHNASAKKALEKVQKQRRARTKLLLTATPFQLEPRQMNRLAKNLLKQRHNILSHPDVASYVEQIAQVFESPEKSGPKPGNVKAVSEILRKLAARTIPRTSNRTYEMLVTGGATVELPANLSGLDDAAVRKFLDNIRNQDGEKRDLKFERAYFKQRVRLATNVTPTYVATQLRRVLSMGTDAQESPRFRALGVWAERTFQNDLRLALDTGLPRKTIVFTAWVGEAESGEAAKLKKLLGAAFHKALASVRRGCGRWSEWLKTGCVRLEEKANDAEDAALHDVATTLRALAENEITVVLAGKHSRFATRLLRALRNHTKAIKEVREELIDLSLHDRQEIEGRALKRRLTDRRGALSPWTSGATLGSVERYTGSERRSARDRAATAFREVGPPWVLVASNVGSEGIDLHTYTARIVHYDLEWNPAKMEQREGRGDRVGRRLKEKLAIMYCLVPRTYDERMFHQLVARDRWHGVLLGKPASQLDKESVEAPLLDRKRLDRMRLNLTPRTIR